MIVDLDLIECGTDLDKVFHCAERAGLNLKSLREVCHCWDMVQIWHDWFNQKFGALKLLQHHSPPDDPPDLKLCFPNQVVAFEHTRLQPEHMGRSEVLRRRQIAPDVCTFVPPISKPTKSNKELIERMLGVNQRDLWTDVCDENQALSDLLFETTTRKIDRLPEGGIVGIVDGIDCMGQSLELLFETAHHLIQSNKFGDFDPYVLIILSRPNPIQYHSALSTKQETVIRVCDKPGNVKEKRLGI